MEQLHKNTVSDKTLDNLKKTMYEQDDYGMQKYNEPLTHEYDYDWMNMFEQEIADGLKYLQCEKDRKRVVVSILQIAMKADHTTVKNQLIEDALNLLTAGGREKKEKVE